MQDVQLEPLQVVHPAGQAVGQNPVVFGVTEELVQEAQSLDPVRQDTQDVKLQGEHT